MWISILRSILEEAPAAELRLSEEHAAAILVLICLALDLHDIVGELTSCLDLRI